MDNDEAALETERRTIGTLSKIFLELKNALRHYLPDNVLKKWSINLLDQAEEAAYRSVSRQTSKTAERNLAVDQLFPKISEPQLDPITFETIK